MSDLYWLTDEQMTRLTPYFHRGHGKPRVDDHRVLSGIIFDNRNGLRWRALAGAGRPRPAQAPLQSLKAIERGRHVRQDNGGPVRPTD